MRLSGISLISGLLISLAACDSPKEDQGIGEVADNTVQDKQVSEGMRSRVNDTTSTLISFYNSLVKSDWVAVNAQIAEDGCWIIYADGAMPQFKKVYKLEDFKNGSGRTLVSLLELHQIESVLDEELPEKNCDTESGYSKEGVFFQTGNNLISEHIWDYADMNEKERQEVAVVSEKATITMVNTASYKFYFMLTGGEFKLVLIDARRPCSA